ncbi:MAG TPA: FAD-binding protein [Deltaproteobacteria bacterium]|nr:FAD-binding protein [Deltaproteobacteria bacterium]
MNRRLRINSIRRCDALIIGAGGAGLRTAVEILAGKRDATIMAVTKVSSPQKSHTTTAQGGFAAVNPKDPIDKPIYHMFDTWKGSDCSSDQNVIKKIVESAWEQTLWLDNHGLHFTRNEEGRFSKRTFGGHTLEFGEGPSAFRAVFEADRTGKGIMDTVWGESLKGKVSFINQSIATELIFKDECCIGAIIFEESRGEFTAVLAKATVISTGGLGQVYKITTNCRQNTGDGLAVVLREGLPVMDLEAVQFHPTGIVGPGILASEALRGEGGFLLNKNMEHFMERYAPNMKDLAPRDMVSRAIETEIREGRGVINPNFNLPHVWLDIRHLSDYVHDVKLPEITGFFKKFAGIDPKKDLCPVRPTVHYHMGGVPTNEFGEAQKSESQVVPGLYAVGESASASFHGFNRLGTNSLLELFTMGKFVGDRVSEYLGDAAEPGDLPKGTGEKSFALFSRYFESKGGENLWKIRETMREMMTEKVGVFRNEKDLDEAINQLQELKERSRHISLSSSSLIMNQELVDRWELDNLLDVAMVIAQGALNRKESRGAHTREDYPERKDEFNYHTVAYMEEYGKVVLGKRPIDMSIFKEKNKDYKRFDFVARKY